MNKLNIAKIIIIIEREKNHPKYEYGKEELINSCIWFSKIVICAFIGACLIMLIWDLYCRYKYKQNEERGR